jgi:hypothetical protein
MPILRPTLPFNTFSPGHSKTLLRPLMPATLPYITISFDNYSSTSQLMADNVTWYTVEDQFIVPSGGTGSISLDTVVAFPGTTKSMRYDYLHPDDGCNSITVKRSILFPSSSVFKDSWADFKVKWTSNFSNINNTCPPNDHKLIFGDTEAAQSGRWGLYVGNGVSGSMRVKVERPTPTGGTGPYALNISSSFDASSLWNDVWHDIKLHFGHSTTTSSLDGRLRLWIDEILLHDETGFNTVKPVAEGSTVDRITGFSFSHNKDDGPPNVLMSIWWGPITIYTIDPEW